MQSAVLSLSPGAFRTTGSGTLDQRDQADRRLGGLMAAAQAGDRAAYDTLLRDSVPLIRAVARGRGVPAGMLDDAVQETLLTVHRARHTYDPARSFNAWLRTIAERRAIDLLRRHGRQRSREVHDDIAYEAHPAAAEAPAVGLDGNVRRAVEALPEGQRQAVEELALKDRTLAEAAEATGRSPGALKVNLHRALKTLRARLAGEDR
jgi:RNA polymerase sigma-70 factor (ECF subfamily)